MFGIFKKQNRSNAFDSFPDLKDYRVYLFLRGGELSEVKARMDEYHEIYLTETAFSTQLYRLGDTPWIYMVLTLLPGVAELSPIWDYFNILLWMSDKVETAFAYAYSEYKGKLPVFALRDVDNQFGDSCKGIANGKHFLATIPEQEVQWGQGVTGRFDYKGYLRENYGIDVDLAK